jgi:curved DNA binding protein
MIKIDLGVHVDGFIAVVAHTIVVGLDFSNAESIATALAGQRGNVISAAYVATEVATKLLKAGNTNQQVTAGIKQVTDAFNVRAISGTLMHQMKQFVVDGSKMILLRAEQDQRVDSCTFETAEVYAIDIAVSSGDGKPRESGHRTTVFKRAVERKYALKNQASRTFFNEVNKKYPTLPFSIRSFADEKAAKLGVRECATHQLLMPYPLLQEKKDDVLGHTKVTVLLMPSGTVAVTGLPPITYTALTHNNPAPATEGIGLTLYKNLNATTGATLPESILELLNEPVVADKKKAKKDAKKAAVSK